MDRAPFLTAAKRYLADIEPYYSPSTLERKERDLRTIHRDLESLNIPKPVAASKLREEHIAALLKRWKSRPVRGRANPGLDLASQEKLLAQLEGLLTWLGNPVIERMRKRRHVRFPRGMEKPIQSLSDDDLARLQTAASAIDGWRGSVARFLVSFLPFCGLRPKEIRLAKLADLDLARGRILVSSPKGEGSWAAPDFAPIPLVTKPAVEDFLAEREAYLRGEASEWLIPLRRDNIGQGIGPWSDASLRKLKGEIQERSGVRFRGLKTFRATFAQTAKDRGATMEAVSRAMRHKTTKTTERYYARIRADNAFAEIERAFERPLKVEPGPTGYATGGERPGRDSNPSTRLDRPRS